ATGQCHARHAYRPKWRNTTTTSLTSTSDVAMNQDFLAPDSHITTGKPKPPRVSDAVLDRLASISSGTLTSQLFKRGYRQPVMVGVRPLNARPRPFAGRAFTMRFIPAREDIDTGATVT